MPDENPKDRKFKTLFDGDEIDGKRYPLEGGVTNLDAFTAGFLIQTGRIEEVDDEHFKTLGKPYKDDETAADRAKASRKGAKAEKVEGEGAGAGDDEAKARLEAAATKFSGGAIPTDLIDASKPETDADRLISKADLEKLAAKDGVEAKGTKTDIAIAIIEARAAKK